jgi:hypothetical protein
MFDHFWDFDRLFENEMAKQSGDRSIFHILVGFLGFRFFVTGMGCRPMGLPMLRPFFNV